MNTAIIFFGQPRFVNNLRIFNTYQESILSKYNPDIFCHAWWEKFGENYSYSSWSNIKSEHPVPHNAVEIIQELYKPLVLETQPPRHFSFTPPAAQFLDDKFTGKHPNAEHWNHKNYSNILSQLYSIQNAASLLQSYSENNKKIYDWIILARYDTILQNFPDLTKCDPSKFYLPGHHPRFPDTIQFFGRKFLAWALNVFNDANIIYPHVWEPSPESFKFYSFLRHFAVTDLQPCMVDAHCVRF
jgi:hypothetical protein